MNEKTIARFWAKVDKAGPVPVRVPHLGPCWVWISTEHRKYKYGSFYMMGRLAKAHRVAWLLERGPIPDGLCVLHRCDNPRCVNPKHLSLGTHAENMADMAAKDRAARGDRSGARTKPESRPRGERHGSAKLTDRDVRAIRDRLRSGEPQVTLAREFGVSQATVCDIAARRLWREVA